MNSLRERIIARHGEAKMLELESAFKPKEKSKREIVHSKRISRKVIRRRREVV